MGSTLYLVRHAQSKPVLSLASPQWALTALGETQAVRLAQLLMPLQIQRVFSSPFMRSRATAAPFARETGLDVVIVGALRERILSNDAGCDSQGLWEKSWDDFAFAAPQCESSFEAQKRFGGAVRSIAERNRGVSAVFTHGHVLSLFLNTLDATFGRKEAEALTNPDVLRVDWSDGVFEWRREFCLAGLDAIATAHGERPGEEPKAPESAHTADASAVEQPRMPAGGLVHP